MARRRAVRGHDGPSAGMLATAGGLVFRGFNDRFVAYSATDGRELWSSKTVNTGIVAAPMTFELDGVQHVAVVAGRATGNYYAPDYSRLLVFRRGATAELPPAREFTPAPLNPPPSVASADEIARGRELYDSNCVLCHDDPGNAGGLFRRGLFPDLAYSPTLPSAEAFAAIVIGGARAANGMASYSGVLDAAQADSIRAYLIREANDSLPANAPR
jgi:quinohemoprotein ethanol dehydrogenase